MKTIIVNGEEYKFRSVAVWRRNVNKNTGVQVQLEVFKNGKVLDSKEVKGYVFETIEEYIMDLI